MRTRSSVALTLIVAISSMAAVAPFVPTGAKIEQSGFATIEQAPSVPYPDAPPPAENQPRSQAEWYARDLGISIEEAARRQREQEAMFPEFNRLQETLRSREAGNYTAARMIHRPDWGYILYFKRDPDKTLAKYTRNRRFQARQARYTRDELERLLKPWTERLAVRNLAGGWSVDETLGTAEIMMNVTEEEYRAIAKREEWGEPLDAVKLSFASPLAYPSSEKKARPFVRIFAQESRATVIQLEAATTAKITLHDGCLRVGTGRKAPLAYFHRETAIGIDEQGYLVFKDRHTGKNRGRIGESFTWAGPNNIPRDDPGAAELRSRCGDAPIVNVGNPESTHEFRVRAWQIDELARRKKISREAAWRRLKACWAKQDAASAAGPPDERCN